MYTTVDGDRSHGQGQRGAFGGSLALLLPRVLEIAARLKPPPVAQKVARLAGSQTFPANSRI